MKKLLFLTAALTIIMMIGCSKKNKDAAHYQFTAEDKQKILDFIDNDTIVYQNQLNQEIKYFGAKGYGIQKYQYVTDHWLMPHEYNYYFYYDNKQLFVSQISTGEGVNCFGMSYDFKRMPIDIRKARANSDDLLESELVASFSIDRYNSDEWLRVDYKASKSEMLIGDTLYKHVTTYKSGNNNAISGYCTRDFNVIYYDDYKGVIGFDDVYGNQWRIKRN